ncbi:putative NAC domain-containing protein [Tripterygium wilfordii]|uniref:Putative NAC domain-containing protein n=1 Tax=Tripterygium wilfordii TaxID=458696 RepID=A0A7J7C6K4_TRIWF|nr:putative NAC domain-containing protein [Tripterygium wilfordii]
MSEDMNLSINGQSQVPPGFRFHPTEEELLHYYLRKKVNYEKIDLDVIREVDLNKLEPWDIQGRAPHGQKSDWIMHEYRLDESTNETTPATNSIGESMPEEGWVVCRVFRKKNYHKTLDSPKCSTNSMDSKAQQMMLSSGNDGVLDQILLYMGRTCKLETESLNAMTNMISNTNHTTTTTRSGINTDNHHHHQMFSERFIHLPRLESPTTLPSLPINSDQDRVFRPCYQPFDEILNESTQPSPTNWVTLDRLVASQLNGQEENVSFSLCPDEDDLHSDRSVYNNNENDLWSFTKSSTSISPSSSDPLCHLSV